MTRVIAVAGPRELGMTAFEVSLSVDLFFRGLPEKVHVIHGNAPGLDRIARDAAERHGHTTTPFPVLRSDAEAAVADGKPERKAPLYRTVRMLDEGRPDEMVAWWDGRSPGTGFTLSQCRSRGIPARVFRTDELVGGRPS